MTNFDVNVTHSASEGIFGLPTNENESKLILLPVPWDVTTSYGKGTAKGPQSIRNASPQLDLFDLETGRPYESGIHMLEVSSEIESLNEMTNPKAQQVQALLEANSSDNATIEQLTKEVNEACKKMNEWVYKNSLRILNSNQKLGIIGGDHSTPLGAIQALSEKYNGDFGILHIDAHADLRKSYQGFTYSHASIMNNVMTSKFSPKILVQVGVRDYCEDEYNFSMQHPKIQTHFDIEYKDYLLRGDSWMSYCGNICKNLPKNVYISFDIDGLEPSLCPNTGTPVPGGLTYDQARLLLKILHETKRNIIGFDLVEVSPSLTDNSEWDANVGARVLYKLCGWLLKKN